MVITKQKRENEFLVDTGDVTADHRPIADVCKLNGFELKTVSTPGTISVIPVIRVKLGPVSYARVIALTVGESVTL